MYTPRRNKATVTFFLGNQKTYFTGMFASFADKNTEIFKFPQEKRLSQWQNSHEITDGFQKTLLMGRCHN